MLGKLLKYELRPGARLLLPLYGVTILMAGIVRLCVWLFMDQPVMQFIAGVTIFGYVILIIATFAITFVFLVQRFYKSLLGDEGYLMFTLPVGIDTHIIVKLLSSIIWEITAFIAMMLSFAMLMIDQLHYLPQILARIIEELARVGISLEVVRMLLTMGLQAITMILMIYAAISLGHMMRGHKLLGSFLAYFGLNVATQFISGLCVALPTVLGMANDNYSSSYMSGLFTQTMNTSLILSIIYAVAYYFIIRFALKNRLNLE